MRPELEKKVKAAVKLLQAFDNPDNPVEIAYSGGKDSDVILQLAKEAAARTRAIRTTTENWANITGGPETKPDPDRWGDSGLNTYSRHRRPTTSYAD